MKEISLIDNEYPFTYIDHTRVVVRALLEVNEKIFLFHHLLADDIFGHRDYYESVGGGVKIKESLETALKRECLEETGYEIEIVQKIGEVIDYYNLIHQKNINHYFYVKGLKKVQESHICSKGDKLIASTESFSLKEAKSLYLAKANEPLARLVANREVPMIEELERLLKSGSF